MGRIRAHRPGPAMVVASIALVVSLGGTAVAAFGPFEGDKLIKRDSLSGNRLRSHTLTGTQINLSRLGVVRTADHANTAEFATSAGTAGRAKSAPPRGAAGGVLTGSYPNPSLAAPEAWHVVGAPGEPAFQNSWKDAGGGLETVAFYKDHDGVVHLKGTATGGTGVSVNNVIFQLPPGYRPATGRALELAVACACATTATDSNSDLVTVQLATGIVAIFGSAITPSRDGGVSFLSQGTQVSLDGITFRAAS